MGKRVTVDAFKIRVQEMWGRDRWKLDQITELPNGMHTAVKVHCPTHGEFSIRAYSLLQGVGCKHCSFEELGKRRTKIIDMAVEGRIIHSGNNYDYSQFVFKGVDVKGEIICPEPGHGSFWQTPRHHLNLKQGCPKCGKLKSANSQRKTTQWFRSRADELHPENDHSMSVYTDTHTPLDVFCRKHNKIFQTRPCDYLNLMHGCPDCGHEKAGIQLRLTREEFIKRAQTMPEHKSINYDDVVYKDTLTTIKLFCKECNTFFDQTPAAHLQGQGCPACYHPVSKWENRLSDYIENSGLTVMRNFREWSGRKEIDIYLPDLNIGFECNGVYYHHSGPEGKSRTYHQDKSRLALESGIRLYHLWNSTSEELNQSVISSKTGVGIIRIFARKTKIVDLSPRDLSIFLITNHVQGDVGKSSNWARGLVDDQGCLVSAMSFRWAGKHTVELSRFACLKFHQVIGGFSKLLTDFTAWGKLHDMDKVISYANGDLTPDPMKSVYVSTGFSFIKEHSYPTLWYCNPKKEVIYNRQKFMKSNLQGVWPDISDADLASKTEIDLCVEHGIYPLYNAGRWKFELLI